MGEQLNILSWNCNGLSTDKKENIDFVKYLTKYDIIFLYETWCSNSSVIELNEYKSINLFRKFQHKKAKRNSGGIVVYLKDYLVPGIELVRNDFDTIIWLKLKKDFFQFSEDIYLSGVYIWCENSPAYNVHNVDLFQVLEDDINFFSNIGSVYVVGDFNARVGNRLDYINCDCSISLIDDDDYVPDVPLIRSSLDHPCNSFGIKLLDLCKSTSMRIANGRLERDKAGLFTYISYNCNSVIDYMLLRQVDFSCIKNFAVESFNEWSDHAPLSFSLECNVNRNTQTDTRYCIYKWNDDRKQQFRGQLIGKLPDFNNVVSCIDISSQNGIDIALNDFVGILRSVSDPVFSKEILCRSNPKFSETCRRAVWFDTDCRQSKRLYIDALKDYNRCKTRRLEKKCVS